MGLPIHVQKFLVKKLDFHFSLVIQAPFYSFSFGLKFWIPFRNRLEYFLPTWPVPIQNASLNLEFLIGPLKNVLAKFFDTKIGFGRIFSTLHSGKNVYQILLLLTWPFPVQISVWPWNFNYGTSNIIKEFFFQKNGLIRYVEILDFDWPRLIFFKK